jgi:hypothetical protein
MNKIKLKQLTSEGSNGFVISNSNGDIVLNGNYTETINNSNKGLQAYNWGDHSTNGYVVQSNTILITKTNLTNLINTNSLDLNKVYGITDSTAQGTIYVRPIAKNNLDVNATWIKNTNLKAFGIIAINGTSGSVNTLTVNGSNIMTASVPYATSLTQTGINLATNINANSGVSGYRAVPITNGHIVIEATTASTTQNGYVISGTATTLTFSSAKPLKKGQNPTPIRLNVIYDLSTDLISYCQDDFNNIISYKGINNNHFNNFPWGYPKDPSGYSYFAYNYIESDKFYDNFIYDDIAYFWGNKIIGGGGQMYQNFMGSNTNNTGGIYYNTLNGGSAIRNNCINLNNSTTTTQFQSNTLHLISSIRDNCFSGNTNTATVAINQNNLYQISSIRDNIATNFTTVNSSIQYNNLSAGSISQNIGNLYIIYNNIYYLSSITLNNFVNGVSTGGIRNNTLNGFQSTISSNVFTGTGTNTAIRQNILNGELSSITSNTLSGTTSTIIGNTINGKSSGINVNTVISNASIRNNIINATDSIITGITLSTDYLSFQNLTWNIDEYSFSFTTQTFNNTTNRGLVNSPITLGYIMPKVIPSNAFVDYGTMTSATSTAQIKIGIETDNDSNILSSTLITSLNGTIQEYSPIFVKPTVLRRIVLTPTVEGLTGGQLKISLKNKIGL